VIALLVAVFFATMALVVGVYWWVNRRTLEAADLARERLSPAETSERAWALLKDERASDVPFINRLLSGREWVAAVKARLERAGSTLSVGSFLLIVVACGVLGTMMAARSTGVLMPLILLIAGCGGPLVWLNWSRKRRMRAFEQQLPEAIDMLVGAMKAGYSFQAAAQFVGQEMPDPLGPEFTRFYDEQRLGMDVRTALLGMQARLDGLDLKMFVTAVLIQRESGGNLSEILLKLADMVRDRIAMKSQIQTLVAEPKISARFLAALPLVVFGLISLVNPHFFDPMTAPGSGGRTAIIASAISIVIGYFIMMRIADVDV
jgi:Flp pilus assembly protein TadB